MSNNTAAQIERANVLMTYLSPEAREKLTAHVGKLAANALETTYKLNKLEAQYAAIGPANKAETQIFPEELKQLQERQLPQKEQKLSNTNVFTPTLTR